MEKVIHWKDGKLLCKICKNYFEEECFDINPSIKHRNGRDNRCKNCKAIKQKERIRSLKGTNKLHYLLVSRLNGLKERSKRKNWDTDVTLEILEALYNKQKGKCAISGIDMTYDVLSGRTPTNLSVDRIDTNLPYTKDNVQLVCMAINQMKNDLTENQLIYFCKEVVKNFAK